MIAVGNTVKAASRKETVSVAKVAVVAISVIRNTTEKVAVVATSVIRKATAKAAVGTAAPAEVYGNITSSKQYH